MAFFVYNPRNRSRWVIIDSRPSVRAVFRRCLRSEAESAARIVFGDEGLKVVDWGDLTAAQRLVAGKFPTLTLARCREMLGVEVHPDHEKRRMKRTDTGTPVAPIYPLPGEFLSKAGGAR
jgi:hypothetical protein